MQLAFKVPLSNPPVYGSPFIMEMANRAIVQRSRGLFEYDVGGTFYITVHCMSDVPLDA